MQRLLYGVFLRDVAWLAITAFGGPQVHLALFLDLLVHRRRYITEQEFMELQALCNILPGPSSSQTIVAIGFKIGGPRLAYLTLLVWCLPGVMLMTLFGLLIYYVQTQNISLYFLKYVQPVAVGLVCFAAYKMVNLVLHTKTGFILATLTTILSYYIRSPWVFPVSVVVGGFLTGFMKRRQQPPEEKLPLKIRWGNFTLFWGVLIGTAILGGLTKFLFIRLFENFYRNGSFIFGGGQVLIPVLFTEFVEFKHYLTKDEFLSGFGLAQVVPGPVFSFVAFIGTLTMREYGIGWQLIGALVASAGIFLPGTFMIFFVIRFWEQLKSFRFVRASLEGIQAASTGLVVAAAIVLLEPQGMSLVNVVIVVLSFLIFWFTKIPPPVLIVLALAAGFIF